MWGWRRRSRRCLTSVSICFSSICLFLGPVKHTFSCEQIRPEREVLLCCFSTLLSNFIHFASTVNLHLCASQSTDLSSSTYNNNIILQMHPQGKNTYLSLVWFKYTVTIHCVGRETPLYYELLLMSHISIYFSRNIYLWSISKTLNLSPLSLHSVIKSPLC